MMRAQLDCPTSKLRLKATTNSATAKLQLAKVPQAKKSTASLMTRFARNWKTMVITLRAFTKMRMRKSVASRRLGGSRFVRAC